MISDIQEFFVKYGEMISTICTMVTLWYVIKNSSKHDENIEKAFHAFKSYWESIYSQQQESFKQKEELFHQNIKPRYEVQNNYSRRYLDDGYTEIGLIFQNKGLGNACNTYVESMIVMAEPPYGETALNRLGPAEKNIIGISETIKFCFSCENVILSQCNEIIVLVTFEDLAGRKYRQKFYLYFHENGQIQLKWVSDAIVV